MDELILQPDHQEASNPSQTGEQTVESNVIAQDAGLQTQENVTMPEPNLEASPLAQQEPNVQNNTSNQISGEVVVDPTIASQNVVPAEENNIILPQQPLNQPFENTQAVGLEPPSEVSPAQEKMGPNTDSDLQQILQGNNPDQASNKEYTPVQTSEAVPDLSPMAQEGYMQNQPEKPGMVSWIWRIGMVVGIIVIIMAILSLFGISISFGN
jgi:hypothetical protein